MTSTFLKTFISLNVASLESPTFRIPSLTIKFLISTAAEKKTKTRILDQIYTRKLTMQILKELLMLSDTKQLKDSTSKESSRTQPRIGTTLSSYVGLKIAKNPLTKWAIWKIIFECILGISLSDVMYVYISSLKKVSFTSIRIPKDTSEWYSNLRDLTMRDPLLKILPISKGSLN
jgi:hypothetical protein